MNHVLFKTNQTNAHGIQRIDTSLRQLGIVSWSLNFADPNHPLRVTARGVAPALIVAALRQVGIECELLTF
ncbi:MAG: hypothetical protein H7Y12_12290 [Sphingobacteriaceae bacterium]|nr:hypothetical protein [Cytophagaceae bacterium]